MTTVPTTRARPTALRATFVLAVALIAAAAGPLALAQAVLPREVRQEILRAVVQVQAYDIASDQIVGAGSGSIISPDGFVLTNFHVVADPNGNALEWHAILTTEPEAPDLLPEFRYWARFIAGDPSYDLAILQIVEYADETPVPAGTVFPFVTLGDSSGMLPGDPITVVGYPGISGDTVTFTSGIVSGFLGEDLTAGGKQWIKTDAKLARGNSGGAAFDQNGLLIGIPTLRTQTTDGAYIEQQDYLRPLTLALPLIQAHVPNVARVGGLGASVAGSSTPLAPGGGPTSPGLRPPGSSRGAQSTAPAEAGAGSVQVGALGPDDLSIDSGEFLDVYVVGMAAGSPVRLEIRSSEIDPYLLILDPNDEVVFEVDDSSGAGLNVAESFTPSVGGEFLVVVTSAFPEEVGRYELRVQGAEIVSGDIAPAEPDTSRAGASASSGPGRGSSAGASDEATSNGGFEAPTSRGSESGFAGGMRPGQIVAGELAGASEAWAYHTYRIDVPQGTDVLTIRLAADDDLDLFLKFGSEIASYADDGDWGYRDIELSSDATLSIRAPQPGAWFVDVAYAVGDPSSVASYELTVE